MTARNVNCFKLLDETSTNESTSGAENIEQTGHTASSDLKERRSDYAEKEGAHHSQQPTKERMDVKDGFRSFVPKNNRPVEMPSRCIKGFPPSDH